MMRNDRLQTTTNVYPWESAVENSISYNDSYFNSQT